MKQKIYILGLASALVIFSGILFKVNHWPGAGIMLTAGFVTLVLIFLPAALIDHYRDGEPDRSLLLHIVTYITCFVVFGGMLFKIQHWPSAGIIILVALPFPFVVFLPVFLTVTSKNKNFNIYNLVFVLMLLALVSVFSALLSLNVARDRINDSYTLSHHYINFESVMKQLPVLATQKPVDIKIDQAIGTINEYRDIILKSEGMTAEQWDEKPYDLKRPDSPAVAAQALLAAGELPYVAKLEKELKDVISVLEKTRGCKDLAKATSSFVGFSDQTGDESSWARGTFWDSNLAWVLIYLDGLKANLLIVKASVCNSEGV
jgi:hypothetical protein